MSQPEEKDPEFRAYYDAPQFRTDTWNELKHLTAARERRERSGRDTTALVQKTERTLDVLEALEQYCAFPGRRACHQLRSLLRRGLYMALSRQTERVVRLLVGDSYRRRDVAEIFHEDPDAPTSLPEPHRPATLRPYFEVLVVDDVTGDDPEVVRQRMLEMRRDSDEFIYDVVVVNSFEDAVIAALFNHNIQSVVLRYSFPFESSTQVPALRQYLTLVDEDVHERADEMPSWTLGEILKSLRPELDLFLVTDDPIRNVAGHTGRSFNRVFYHQEDYLELHLSILCGIQDRYETPFFDALRSYSHRPTGVFHAMPISRGKSIMKSHWIRDMGDFYGSNIFLAETSATSGGLDSLLQPHGPIKRAQEKVARAFGSRQSYLVTNGTSTANKIVLQALMRPGDIALVSRDCHKSHHYSIMLSGAYPVYMDPYPLTEYSMYGAVPLVEIKRHLLALRRAGKLDRVRLLLLTNCTFDGLVYHPERIMQEVLAIKPDMVFVWDEAWFAFARFAPTYRRRTAMEAARRLRRRLQDPEYAETYAAWRAELDPRAADDDAWLEPGLLPDPAKARVRVYSTQSTHKTLTSLRQGSMIHVYDQDFDQLVREAFDGAYMTHTSTSPNYQIVASLDVGRRQVELEGYEMVEDSVSLAMTLRERIEESPLLRRYFSVLTVGDLIPEQYRPSGLQQFYSTKTGYADMETAYRQDEIALDPVRITIHIGRTGMDGDTFRSYLMDRFDIQINKTSRNTVLFMLNIGTTRGALAYLLEVLNKIAQELTDKRENESAFARGLDDQRVDALTKKLPPLPNFSRFHPRFSPAGPACDTPEGDLRAAYFAAYDHGTCEFLALDGPIESAMAQGREVVSAAFVTPYPPGFPVLVPGQVISPEILAYLRALDVKEIHGYNPEYGFRVFKQAVLEQGLERSREDAKTLPSTQPSTTPSRIGTKV